MVADIVEEAADDEDDDQGDDDYVNHGDNDRGEDEDRGPILRKPSQFGKLATLDAENKNIRAFLSNPEKVNCDEESFM